MFERKGAQRQDYAERIWSGDPEAGQIRVVRGAVDDVS